MSASGYSGTPLLKKLGIVPEMKVLLISAPDNYFTLLETDIGSQVIKQGKADFVHLFATDKKKLETGFLQLIKTQPPTCIIWISWYKKSAKMATDITEDSIREIVLPTGWVDVKVCSVSELWSGLKIVLRKKPPDSDQHCK